MATYVIGDLQGCFDSFMELLTAINFDEHKDKLWFVGDLINRGPKSLQCINFVKNLVEKHQAVTVLGNHDIFLLLCAENLRQTHHNDTLNEILNLPPAKLKELSNWLRRQPICHLEKIGERNFLLTHAGIFPSWNLEKVLRKANRVEHLLKTNNKQKYLKFLDEIWGNTKKDVYHKPTFKHTYKNEQFLVNVFTRMRFCRELQPKHKQQKKLSKLISLDFSYKGEIINAPENLVAWFDLYKKYQHSSLRDVTVLFGHWSALGLNIDKDFAYAALDTGCLWGRKLTALRLEDKKVFQVNSVENSV